MEQTTLFERRAPQPLAARLRPRTLEEYVGQTHLLGPGKVLRRLIESDPGFLDDLLGPAGRGAKRRSRGSSPTRQRPPLSIFRPWTSGIKEIRAVMQQAEDNRRFGEKTILFVDEIHRFNKASRMPFSPLSKRAASS